MFIETSAIVAILAREPEMEAFIALIDRATPPLFTSPIVVYEASVSLAKLKTKSNKPILPTTIKAAEATIMKFLDVHDIKQVIITLDIAQLAISAAAQYCKAVAHPAKLNFGDCFSYACAKVNNLPMLFKGNDFPQTDIELPTSR